MHRKPYGRTVENAQKIAPAKTALEIAIAEAKERAAERLNTEIETIKTKEATRLERIRVNEEANRVTTALRKELEAKNDMTDHPKADLLWSKAWEHGHSSGLEDVRCWYNDLVELIK